MRPDDFYVKEEWNFDHPRRIDTDVLSAIRQGPLKDHDDVEVAPILARLIHDDLERYGTGGGQEMDEPQMREALVALRNVLARMAITDFSVPFRDYATFRSWWVKNGAHGSWQARRDLLSGVFDDLHETLYKLEQKSLDSSLATPVTTHPKLGWPGVDVEITELRRHFQNAKTEQDYRNVGNDCVAVTESLSRQVYKAEKHLKDGETEPPVAKTKDRLDRFIEVALPGADNAALRKMARSAIELAQDVKHSGSPDRTKAGIAADSVILLANILRRLDEPSAQ